MFKKMLYKIKWFWIGNKCSKCIYDDICVFPDSYKTAQTYGSLKCCGYQRKK